MKTVLVTGAAGFVGANVTRRLLKDGHEVHVLLRPDQDTWRLHDIGEEVRAHRVSISDFEALSSVVEQVSPEWIFHLAAHGAYPSQADYRRMVDTNLLGTMNLVEACLEQGFEALVNSGSSSEYGFKDHPPQEAERPDPNSNYAVTKAAATMYCRYAAEAHDVHIVTLRLYSVYGPYEEPSRLWPTLLLEGMKGRLPELADPQIARDFVYVEDVVDAYLGAASASGVGRGSVFNVGTGLQTTLRELVDLARKELEIDQEPRWGTMQPRSWDTSVWVADPRRIRQELGWAPRYSVAEGFRRFVEWFRTYPDISRLYASRLERG